MRKISEIFINGVCLEKILEDHEKWTIDSREGKRLELKNVDLSYVNLRGANLSCTDLSFTDLSDAYLGFADLWDANFLEEQLYFILEHRAVISCASCRRIDENNQEILQPFIVPTHITYKDMLRSCHLPCLSTILDREQLKNITFNTHLHSLRDDYVLWLSLIKQTGCAYGNTKVLTSYRLTSTAATANKWKVIKPQFLVYYRIEKLGLIRSIYYLIHWAYYGLKKYSK